METKPCAICGTEFEKPYTTSRAEWAKRQFCSRACFGKSRRTGPQIKACQKCGAEFTRKRLSNEGWANQRYCSHACAYADRKGERHPNWKNGGRFQIQGGYIATTLRPDHPFFVMAQRTNRRVLEHRLVMAEHLGRPLEASETVHHINGDRSDNRLENLQVRRSRHGKGAKCVCGDCGSENIVEVPL